MNKKDEDLLNIGVLLSEDTEKLEVMYEGFDICNFIANQTITPQKEIESFYAKLPLKARQAIEKRDKKV